jgi:hypothetical protein
MDGEELKSRSIHPSIQWQWQWQWLFNSCHGGLYVDSVFHSFFNQSTYLGSFDIKLILFSENVEISPPKKK